MGESRLPFAFTWSPAVFTIISKRELHGNVILRFFRPAEFLLLYRHEHFIRNNGLMGVGVKESIHETIIFDLDSTSADRFLKQYPSGVFFIGEQFVNRLPIPFWPAGGGGDTLLFQTSSNFPKTVTCNIPCKYPAHYLRLIGIYRQLTIRTDFIPIALAFCHFGTAVPKTLPQAYFDGLAFLKCVHWFITSVAKDRKAPSGGKSRTREADDAANFA